MECAPCASLPSTSARCTVATACSPILTCFASKGQSHGCVVFSNYPEFLNAFLKGEVTRLVVVERLENPPGAKIASGSRVDDAKDRSKASDRLYAAAGGH